MSGWIDKVWWALKDPFTATVFLYICVLIFSTPPVVPYLLRSTVSCITESHHGSLASQNAYQNVKILFNLNPHTHIRCVRLFHLGYYRTCWLLYDPCTALSRSSFLDPTWCFQRTWSAGEDCILKADCENSVWPLAMYIAIVYYYYLRFCYFFNLSCIVQKGHFDQ
jgi:hypothetical protein